MPRSVLISVGRELGSVMPNGRGRARASTRQWPLPSSTTTVACDSSERAGAEAPAANAALKLSSASLAEPFVSMSWASNSSLAYTSESAASPDFVADFVGFEPLGPLRGLLAPVAVDLPGGCSTYSHAA